MLYDVDKTGVKSFTDDIDAYWAVVFWRMWNDEIRQSEDLPEGVDWDAKIVMATGNVWHVYYILPLFSSFDPAIRALNWLSERVEVWDPPAMILIRSEEYTFWIGGITQLGNENRADIGRRIADYIGKLEGTWLQALAWKR